MSQLLLAVKHIKREIYGKPQRLLVTYPGGCFDIAKKEILTTLSHAWFPQKFYPTVESHQNKILLSPIHMVSMMELLVRATTLSDLRLIIYEGKAFGLRGLETKCKNINWDWYLNKKMRIKIKANSIASKAYHESAICEVVNKIIQSTVSDDQANETTTLYIDFYKNKLTISLSLAGSRLYKRGYREELSASAPLREDLAAACIREALTFAKRHDSQYSPDKIMVPFAGTGTLAFEFLLQHNTISPALLGRSYAIQFMPFFRAETFQYLLKQSMMHFNHQPIDVLCIDSADKAILVLKNNLENFKKLLSNDACLEQFKIEKNDFFQMHFAEKNRTLFLPLNPPYGIRLGSEEKTVTLYKNIARKLQQIPTTLAGFILCPTEAAWSIFCRNMSHAELETYHMTQGGLDVRVCQFFVKGL